LDSIDYSKYFNTLMVDLINICIADRNLFFTNNYSKVLSHVSYFGTYTICCLVSYC